MQPMPEDKSNAEASQEKGLKNWFKRIGVAGFLFFLIKGLVWIAIWVAAWMGFKTCESEPEDGNRATQQEELHHELDQELDLGATDQH